MTIEDKKQQENLKNFDRNLKESTGQLAWFLYGMFAAFALMLGMVLIFDGIFYQDAWLILCYVWMVVYMDNYGGRNAGRTGRNDQNRENGKKKTIGL
mgnify:CR=1 FL=1